jgi:hypothetical protein
LLGALSRSAWLRIRIDARGGRGFGCAAETTIERLERIRG